MAGFEAAQRRPTARRSWIFRGRHQPSGCTTLIGYVDCVKRTRRDKANLGEDRVDERCCKQRFGDAVRAALGEAEENVGEPEERRTPLLRGR